MGIIIMSIPSKKLKILLKYIIPIIMLLSFVWLFLLSRSAALIFNRAMEEQDMLQGTITVESIQADVTGHVEFENLKWKDPDGETILSVPEGELRVRLWDIITNHITATTLKELILRNALVSLRFDENMQVDFIRHTPIAEDMQKKQKKKPNPLAGKSEEERRIIGEENRQRSRKDMELQWKNFNHQGKHLKMSIILENCPIEVFYKKRQYYLSGVYFKAGIDTEKELHLKLYTGRFGGTMVGSGMTIRGFVDLSSEVMPECDLAVTLQDVQPDSLGFGLNIQDTLTLNAYFTGPVSHPEADGNLHMDRLRIPGMEFQNVNGNIHYEDALISFHNVSAGIFGGTLNAEGDYNIDTRYYHIHGLGKNLQASKALRGSNLVCPVDLDMYLVSNESARQLKCYGSFTSGPGRYTWIPFDKISGRFSNAYRDLRFYDARIDIGSYQLRSDFISIIDGKLTISPIDLVNTETNEVRMTYEHPNK